VSIWGDDLDGRNYNEVWDHGATKTRPPEDFRWHHNRCVFGHGKDVVAMKYDSAAEFRAIRLAWLDQFELRITEEGDYRWWTWYDGDGSVRWAERRLVSAPLPKIPGLWPADE
jgi:hypothetical protein